MATAADLIVHDLTTGSRLSSEQMVWVITAKNGVTCTVKFQTGFVKKHLYTSSKKPLNDGETQANKDVEKFQKQLDHRSGRVDKALTQAEIAAGMERQVGGGVRLCMRCGHPEADHRTAAGTLKVASAGKSGCRNPCPCRGWTEGWSAYELSRQQKAKLDNTDKVNEPTTNTNTAIWMNKIDKEAFKNVVTDSIIDREAELAAAGKAWNQTTDGEKLTWNFKDSPESVVVLTDKDPEEWDKRVTATVGIRKLNSHLPTYTVFHMYP
jgi:hypothetical protein